MASVQVCAGLAKGLEKYASIRAIYVCLMWSTPQRFSALFCLGSFNRPCVWQPWFSPLLLGTIHFLGVF